MAVTALNVSRHYEIFDPYKFNEPVTVIGAGATGSWLTMMLAKLGIVDINVYDFDKVEEHNVPNQLYGLEDINSSKIGALHRTIKITTGTTINVKNEKFDSQRVDGVVFLMVDSMRARKAIWNQSIKFKSAVKLLIEPRMGADCARIYNVHPIDPTQIKRYETTFYSDEEAEELSACGNSMSVVTSAATTAAWCVRQLIEWSNGQRLDNEILIDYKFNQIYSYQW